MARVFLTTGTASPTRAETSNGGDLSDESELETDTETLNQVSSTNSRTPLASSANLPVLPLKRQTTAIARSKSSMRDSSGRLPLQKACERGDVAQVRALVALNVNLEDRDYAGTTALHEAALNGHYECVQLLLKAGAVVDVRSAANELDTPLIDASANGHLECVKLLLSHGADPRVSNACGRCALDFVRSSDANALAIREALRTRVFELRARGAPVVTRWDQPQSPPQLFPPNFSTVVRLPVPSLMELSRKRARSAVVTQAASGHMAYVGAAIERGWEPTPDALVLASRYGHADVVNLLLAFGLSPNAQHEGTFALKEAVKRCHLPVAQLLVDAGASQIAEMTKYVADLVTNDPMRVFVEEKVAQLRNTGKPVDTFVAEEPKLAKKRIPGISKSVLRSIKPKKRTKSGETELVAVYNRLEDAKVGSSSYLNADPSNSDPTNSDLAKLPAKSDLNADPTNSDLAKLPTKSDLNADLTDSDLTNVPTNSDLTNSNPTNSDPTKLPTNSAPLSASLPASPSDPPSANLPESYSPNSPSIPSEPLDSAPPPTSKSPSSPPSTHLRLASPSVPNHLTQSSPHLSPHSPSTASDEVWTERSEELSKLAERKRAQRRDREAQMLRALTQRRFSSIDSDESLPDSQKPNIVSANGDATLLASPISVSHLPWALRMLAHTGSSPRVTPLISHEINGEAHLVDAQVALALSDAKLHRHHPQLQKASILPALKEQLWPFCRPWLCRPGDFGSSLSDDRQRFYALPLCWLRADEVQPLFAETKPAIVPVALQPRAAMVAKSPLRAAKAQWRKVRW